MSVYKRCSPHFEAAGEQVQFGQQKRVSVQTLQAQYTLEPHFWHLGGDKRIKMSALMKSSAVQ